MRVERIAVLVVTLNASLVWRRLDTQLVGLMPLQPTQGCSTSCDQGDSARSLDLVIDLPLVRVQPFLLATFRTLGRIPTALYLQAFLSIVLAPLVRLCYQPVLVTVVVGPLVTVRRAVLASCSGPHGIGIVSRTVLTDGHVRT